jgi:hypothetical protein
MKQRLKEEEKRPKETTTRLKLVVTKGSNVEVGEEKCFRRYRSLFVKYNVHLCHRY